MKANPLYILLFLLAVALRLFLHYRTELIPGINGGYYLVQVRSLLEKGELGFPDFPLYFYLLAFITKAGMLLTKLPLEIVSMQVVKIVDAIAFPLSIVPLYWLLRRKNLSLWQQALIVCSVLFSFSGIMMLGDFQKNGFAIPFLLAFVYFGGEYLRKQKNSDLIKMLSCFGLIALTHFGASAFAMTYLIIGLLIHQGWPSIWKAGLVFLAVLSLAFWFDVSRAVRLLTFVTELFSRPALFHSGPPELLLYAYVYALLYYGYRILRKQNRTEKNSKIFQITLVLIALLTFPLINGDYARRLNMMLIVPIAVLLPYLLANTDNIFQKRLSLGVWLLTLIPALGSLPMKQASIDEAAFEDLMSLRDEIELPENTLIIARHGLEWWANWSFHTKVGNSRAIQDQLHEQYEQILFLEEQQKDAPRTHHPPMPPFEIPKPDSGRLIEQQSTKYFKLSRWILD